MLSGTYARDEARRGTFRAMRAGAVESVGTKKTQAERQREIMQGDGGQER